MKTRLIVVLAACGMLTAALAAPASAATGGLLDGGLGELVGQLLSSVIPGGILG
ncbi:hypothetical protein [Nonomuraea aridisoli]|uniref:hypothetical protein n=1 Tax=Nonomuraea aridisoli TaxID=2070368 RepID=UPI0015E894E7|nr:hypothetical protein [Nonomuraea aridisoli]